MFFWVYLEVVIMGRVAPNKRRLRHCGCSHMSESVRDRCLSQNNMDMQQSNIFPFNIL